MTNDAPAQASVEAKSRHNFVRETFAYHIASAENGLCKVPRRVADDMLQSYIAMENRLSELADANTNSEPLSPPPTVGAEDEAVRGELPIWKEGWIAERLSAAMHAYLAEYVWSPDEGCDHEPTEFERMIMEDMLNGALSAKAVGNLLQDAAFAMVNTSPAPAADGQMVKVEDWLAVAKAAGQHGVRYRTNRALEAFLSDIRACLATDKEGA
jgi:hypothetical protein